MSEERDDDLDAQPAASTSAGPVAHYPASALGEGQPRLTDLVPQRPWVLALLFMVGLGVTAGLVALYDQMPRWADRTTDGRIASFDLDGEGSLAVWWSSALLTLAAGLSIAIYLVRRHRQDDYRGRYRGWPWAAFCWLVMSVDETGSLHEAFKELMSQVAGTRLSGDGSLWWVLAYATVLGSLGLWLLLEVRESRGTLTLFLLAGVSLAVAVAAQLEWLLPQSGARGVMLEEACEMLGYQLIVFALAVYARHVVRDARGEVPVVIRAKRRKKKPAIKAPELSIAEDDDTDSLDEPVSPPAPPRTPLFSRPTPTISSRVDPPKPQPPKPAAAPKPATAPDRVLSKAERKALARAARRDR